MRPPPRTGVTDLVALVHVELESRASTLAFRPRMFEYYVQLRRDTGLPVLPIALFLRVGLDGIGWDAYEEHLWEQRIVRFEYAYVGLPALDGEQYATGENLLGVALSALMRLPVDRRAELYAEGLKRIAGSGENDYRRFLRNFSKMPSARQLVRWFGDQAALQTGSGNLCSGRRTVPMPVVEFTVAPCGFQHGQGQYSLWRPTHSPVFTAPRPPNRDVSDRTPPRSVFGATHCLISLYRHFPP